MSRYFRNIFFNFGSFLILASSLMAAEFPSKIAFSATLQAEDPPRYLRDQIKSLLTQFSQEEIITNALISFLDENAITVIDIKNKYDENALQIAVAGRNDAVVRILLSAARESCDMLIFAKTHCGVNALQIAAFENKPYLLDLLIKKVGERATELIFEADNDGRTVLHLAARFPQLLRMIIKVMKERGDDEKLWELVTLQRKRGGTSFHICMCQGYIESAKILWQECQTVKKKQELLDMVVEGLNIFDLLEKYNHSNAETMLALIRDSLDWRSGL